MIYIYRERRRPHGNVIGNIHSLNAYENPRCSGYVVHSRQAVHRPNCQKQKITCRENRKKENRKRERERKKNRQQRLEVTFVVTTVVLAPPELPLLDVLEDSQQPLHPTRRIFPSTSVGLVQSTERVLNSFFKEEEEEEEKRGVFYLFFLLLLLHEW